MSNAANFPWHPVSIAEDQESQSFANQRFRTWLDVTHPSDQAGAYMQVEIGHNTWGEHREFTKTHTANGNVVGMELRRAFLWWKPSNASEIRAGIQGFHDAFGDVLASSDWDFNVGGVSYQADRGALSYATGFYVLGDTDVSSANDDSFLFATDIDASHEAWDVGGSLYYLQDRGDYSYGTFGGPGAVYHNSWDLWMGLRGKYRLDGITLDGFLLYNSGGTESPDWDHSGLACKLAGDAVTPFGLIKVQLLYATGDDDTTDSHSDEFRTLAQSERDNFGSQGYWSYLGLTSPRGSSDVNDLGVGLQNRGLGLIALQAGLEMEVREDFLCYVAGGWLQSAEDNPTSNASEMGFELLGEATWHLLEDFHLETGAAYLFTGDFYKAPGDGSPADLYELFLRLQLEF